MEILSLGIVGAIVSLLVQFLKTKYETKGKETILIVIGLSIIFGTSYYFIKDTSLIEPIIQILVFAGAIYAYIFKQLEVKD